MDGQLARGPGVPRHKELLAGGVEEGVPGRGGKGSLERAWPRAITGPRQPRHYPQLSACVLRLGFRGPSGRETRESHRGAPRPKRPRKPERSGQDKEPAGPRGKERTQASSPPLCGVWRQKQIDPARFDFLGLCIFSRATRPQGMRPIHREGLMLYPFR